MPLANITEDFANFRFLHCLSSTLSETSGSDNLREALHLQHYLWTEIDSADEVITGANSSFKVSASTGWLGGFDEATSDDPFPEPDLVVPEFPGEELVSSFNIGFAEAIFPHDLANDAEEEPLEYSRLSHCEEFVDSPLKLLHEVDLVGVCLELISKGTSLVFGPV